MSHWFEPIEPAVVTWRDGQPQSERFDDIYFSADNGLHEAQHVFIEGNQLISRWQALTHDYFVVAEIGFGTGLNFLLSWSLWQRYAPASAQLYFITCEKYPLSPEDLSRSLSLWPELQDEARQLISHYTVLTPGMHALTFAQGRVHLRLMLGDALHCYRELLVCGDVVLEKKFREYGVDAWFLDGFSPAKNPELWSPMLFTVMAILSKKETTLATFSSATDVRQGLQAAGFCVQKKPGYGRKREMLIAHFGEILPARTVRYTPWQAYYPTARKKKTALVLGAGLAGCYMAYALSRRGWSVTLLDAKDRVGSGASGNQHAILYPKLSAFYAPLNALMLSAYLFAVRTYKAWLTESPMGELKGMLQLAHHPKVAMMQQHLQQWLRAYPQLGKLVDVSEASQLAGISLRVGGLFMPHSGWLNMQALCEFLRQKAKVHYVGNTCVSSIDYEGEKWHAAGHQASILVIANGHGANQLTQTAHLPLKSLRGQITFLTSNEETTPLQIPICAQGHITPALQGVHALGATYHSGSVSQDDTEEDDWVNIAKLETISTILSWSQKPLGHWVGVRSAAPDYLPLVGPVAHPVLFEQQLAGLASNSKRWLPTPGAYYEGLYLCAGFGSRGLTTIPLSAEWLAGLINKEPTLLPRSLVQALSPARFLRRNMIRNGSKKVEHDKK